MSIDIRYKHIKYGHSLIKECPFFAFGVHYYEE